MGWHAFALNYYLAHDDVRDRASRWIVANIPRGTTISCIRRPYWSAPSIMQAVIHHKGDVLRNYYVIDVPQKFETMEVEEEGSFVARVRRLFVRGQEYRSEYVPDLAAKIRELDGEYFILDSVDGHRYEPLHSMEEIVKAIEASGYGEVKSFSALSTIPELLRSTVEPYTLRGSGTWGVRDILVFQKSG